jgi:hypothetical protein
VPILRIDHFSIKGKLLGMWQAFHSSGVRDIRNETLIVHISTKDINMKTIKFVVKVNRGGTRAPEYVQRIDPTPIQMTTDRKQALIMGKFTAEDAVKSLQNSRCIPELESVHLSS